MLHPWVIQLLLRSQFVTLEAISKIKISPTGSMLLDHLCQEDQFDDDDTYTAKLTAILHKAGRTCSREQMEVNSFEEDSGAVDDDTDLQERKSPSGL